MQSIKHSFVQWIVAFLLVGATVSPAFAGARTNVEFVHRIHILCNDPGACPCPGC